MSLKKAPDSLLPFGFDYTNWLDPGETIVSAVWSAASTNADTEMSIDHSELAGMIVQTWLSGGTPGLWYAFTVLVTTSSGKVDERALHIGCELP